MHIYSNKKKLKIDCFVRKRERVRELAAALEKQGIKASYLEGEMAQTQRNEAIKRVESGKCMC